MRVHWPGKKAHGGRAVVIAYVDDLLIITDDEHVEQAILAAIGVCMSR